LRKLEPPEVIDAELAVALRVVEKMAHQAEVVAKVLQAVVLRVLAVVQVALPVAVLRVVAHHLQNVLSNMRCRSMLTKTAN
jgi:hypothetical protein